MSVELPGAKATTMRMGFSGKAARLGNAPEKASSKINRKRVMADLRGQNGTKINR